MFSNKKAKELEAALQALQQEKETVEQSLAQAKTDIGKLQSERDQHRKELEEERRTVEATRGEKQQLVETNKDLQQRYAELNLQYEADISAWRTSHDEVSTRAARATELEGEFLQLRAQFDRLEKSDNERQAENERLATEYQTKIAKAEEELAEVHKRFQLLQEKMTARSFRMDTKTEMQPTDLPEKTNMTEEGETSSPTQLAPMSPEPTEKGKRSTSAGGRKRPKSSRSSASGKCSPKSPKSAKQGRGPKSPLAPESPMGKLTTLIGADSFFNSSKMGDLFDVGDPNELVQVDGINSATPGKEKSLGDIGSSFGDIFAGEEDVLDATFEIDEALLEVPKSAESPKSPTVGKISGGISIDTSDQTKRLRTQLVTLKDELKRKSQEIERLESVVAEKVKELVDQGEKNYQLYEKLQALKTSESGMRQELEDMRTLVVKEIAGPGAEPDSYKNVANEELIKILNQAMDIKSSNSNRANGVINEARQVRKALASASSSLASPNFDGDLGFDDANELNGGSLLSRVESMQLESENKILKQTNRRLQNRIDEMEAIERTGLAALESMNQLKKRGEDLGQRLRREKDMRMKTEEELNKAADRVKALTSHIEKLMIHMKHEAAAKKTAQTDLKNYRKEATILRQRNAVLTKKNKSKERMLEELREGSRILEDQLRLMDQKYVQLRTKLDWTRATSNKEVKRIQQEANRIRASFALAFSQIGGGQEGSSLLFNVNGLLNNSDAEEDDDEDEEDDDDSDSGEESDASGEKSNNQKPREESQKEPNQSKLKQVPTRSPPPVLRGGLETDGSSRTSLPAIESIIPQGERYKGKE